MRILKKRVTIFYEPCYILQTTGQSNISDPNIYTVKIMRMRKAVSNTEHPAIIYTGLQIKFTIGQNLALKNVELLVGSQ